MRPSWSQSCHTCGSWKSCRDEPERCVFNSVFQYEGGILLLQLISNVCFWESTSVWQFKRKNSLEEYLGRVHLCFGWHASYLGQKLLTFRGNKWASYPMVPQPDMRGAFIAACGFNFLLFSSQNCIYLRTKGCFCCRVMMMEIWSKTKTFSGNGQFSAFPSPYWCQYVAPQAQRIQILLINSFC